MMTEADRERVRRDFHGSVNMSPAELEEWLATSESRKVGWKGINGDRPESIGHASGRLIVQILRKREDELSDDDLLHMRKVVGFIRRHLAQQPANIYTSPWRYSLMNWGHDPLKGE